MIRLILIFLTFTSLLLAEEKTVHKSIVKSFKQGNLQVTHFDLNGDGKIDRIEKKKEGSIVEIEEDVALKGTLNKKVEFFTYKDDSTPIEISRTDGNYDGKIDRVETIYRHEKIKKIITNHQVDSKFSGSFDKTFTTTENLDQKKSSADCLVQMIKDDPTISKLAKDVEGIQFTFNQGFYESDFGYKIHQSCLKNWGGKEFMTILKDSMFRGMKCLDRLAQENAKEGKTPNGALKISSQLKAILSQSKVTIGCHENNYDWTSTYAHASVSNADNNKKSNLNHPYISLNPNHPATKSKPDRDEQRELTKTIFHEQLHNLGLRHSENIEYPYTCETCCLDSNKPEDKERVDSACAVCKGNYTGTSDLQYVKDMVKWGELDYQTSRAQSSVVKYLKEFPASRDGLFLYAEATNGVFNPIGRELSKELTSRFRDLSSNEKAIVEKIKGSDYFEFAKNPQISSYAKIASGAILAKYHDQNPKKMLEVIGKNKKEIADLIAKQAKATNDDKYILDSIKKSINDLLVDTWLDGYPKNSDKPENIKAYKLLLDLKLL